LWKGGQLASDGAEVARKKICLPKKEGGLGVKNLEVWNQVAIVKHLWVIYVIRQFYLVILDSFLLLVWL